MRKKTGLARFFYVQTQPNVRNSPAALKIPAPVRYAKA